MAGLVRGPSFYSLAAKAALPACLSPEGEAIFSLCPLFFLEFRGFRLVDLVQGHEARTHTTTTFLLSGPTISKTMLCPL